MTKEKAVEMLKSKMDGKTDTSYEWAETVRMAINALEKDGGNSEMMLFPKDWRDFLEYYCFKDTEEIYTNGSYLVQKLRAEQALEHYADGLIDRVLAILDEEMIGENVSFKGGMIKDRFFALKGGE